MRTRSRLLLVAIAVSLVACTDRLPTAPATTTATQAGDRRASVQDTTAGTGPQSTTPESDPTPGDTTARGGSSVPHG